MLQLLAKWIQYSRIVPEKKQVEANIRNFKLSKERIRHLMLASVMFYILELLESTYFLCGIALHC